MKTQNKQQKRIILDTSVYGELTADKETLINIKIKNESHEIIFYGGKIIRQELRETPKHATMEGKGLRILLLEMYDSIVGYHDLKSNKLIETLSEDYFKSYKDEGGSLSNREMRNDLIIIAIATIYQLDIIVSSDKRSMLSDKAIRAYKKVNQEYGMKDPVFKTYAQFKEEVSRGPSQYDTE